MITSRTVFCIVACGGEDEAIPKDNLLDYWYREGFLDCDHSESLHEAQDRGHKNIGTLVSYCLLQEVSKDNGYLKMHNVVREMCLWLTSREFNVYGKFFAYLEGDHN